MSEHRPGFPLAGFTPGPTPPAWAARYAAGDFPPFAYTSDVLGFTVAPGTDTLLALVIVRGEDGPYQGLSAWPGGFVNWASDQDAHAAALREMAEETGERTPLHMETLDTYDTLGRDPRQWAGSPGAQGVWQSRGTRVVSKAFLALFPDQGPVPSPLPGEDPASARWTPVSEFLPWEDLRGAGGRARVERIVRALARWARSDTTHRAQRQQRIAFAFGGPDLEDWNEERVPERFALLMEAGLLPEAHRDVWGAVARHSPVLDERDGGVPMAFDHRRMLADGLARLRGRMKYRPVLLASLLPPVFPLKALVRTVEAVGGRTLHEPNFRRVVTQTEAYRIVVPAPAGVPLSETDTTRAGPKPQMVTFPPDVALRRLDPAIRLPWND